MIEEGHCGYCREPLPGDAVSDYFCHQGHQDLYYRQNSVPIDHLHRSSHPTWDEQAQQIRATMTGMREAFTAFGEALDRLTDRAR